MIEATCFSNLMEIVKIYNYIQQTFYNCRDPELLPSQWRHIDPQYVFIQAIFNFIVSPNDVHNISNQGTSMAVQERQCCAWLNKNNGSLLEEFVVT